MGLLKPSKSSKNVQKGAPQVVTSTPVATPVGQPVPQQQPNTAVYAVNSPYLPPAPPPQQQPHQPAGGRAVEGAMQCRELLRWASALLGIFLTISALGSLIGFNIGSGGWGSASADSASCGTHGVLLHHVVVIYLALFGILIALAELDQLRVRLYFHFLAYRSGRGALLIFCGSLSGSINQVGLATAGGLCILLGLISLALSIFFSEQGMNRDKTHTLAHDAASRAEQGQAGRPKKSGGKGGKGGMMSRML